MAIIENQNVAKRRVKQNKSHTSNYAPHGASYGNSYNSARYNSEFMSHFDQKPARSRKKRPHSYSAGNSVFAFFSGAVRKLAKPGDGRRKTQRTFPSSPKRNERKPSGFSFPVPSPAKILAVAGTIFVAVIALNWEGADFLSEIPQDFQVEIKTPDIYAIQPSVENSGAPTTKYASTGELGNISRLGAGIENKEPLAEDKEQITDQAMTGEETPPSTSGSPAVETEKDTASILIAFDWQQYTVKKGESVSSIAKKFGVSVGAVIASNEISNARRLREGAVLRIPTIDGVPYTINAGDSLSKISVNFNVPLEVILDVNDIKSDKIRAGEVIFIPGGRMNDIDLRKSLGDLFVYPAASKYITSRFGMRKDPINGHLSFHTGIDLRAREGEIIMAAMEGTVSVTSENRIYGKYIILTHSNGYKTLYAHLNSFSVKQGDRVGRGNKIGEAGNTGYSTASHLHFSVYDKNNKFIDPLDLLS